MFIKKLKVFHTGTMHCQEHHIKKSKYMHDIVLKNAVMTVLPLNDDIKTHNFQLGFIDNLATIKIQ